MKRTQYKGRTLVLKIKLHTYEVFSRQVQPPKAVYTAEELYHYSLPMLEKLEKEIPGMKLRLMGLRCTHLVSTKKGDVDFFGRARQASTAWTEAAEDSPAAEKVPVDDEGWQIWPDSEFEDAERREREDEAEELNRLSQHEDLGPDAEASKEDEDDPDYKRYANGFAWRSILEEERAEAEAEAKAKSMYQSWQCPICSKHMRLDEKGVNEHVDLCLSRQTIKEIVKTTDEVPETKASSPTPANTAKRKRSQPSAGKVPRSSGESEKKARRAFFA